MKCLSHTPADKKKQVADKKKKKIKRENDSWKADELAVCFCSLTGGRIMAEGQQMTFFCLFVVLHHILCSSFPLCLCGMPGGLFFFNIIFNLFIFSMFFIYSERPCELVLVCGRADIRTCAGHFDFTTPLFPSPIVSG